MNQTRLYVCALVVPIVFQVLSVDKFRFVLMVETRHFDRLSIASIVFFYLFVVFLLTVRVSLVACLKIPFY